ncbi:uncharacterized protein LOC108145630 [Drosophila elegans]|uniref:uncharacterized protein LOC108145630 n=1 Tax=Drosophila elegans TaxID=30023 RepID=UPI0007E694A9|nr:uncharacterized protein LOC108145630 [Drosophila elegans]
MAFVPISKCFGIDIEWNKPKKFSNAAAEKTWMEKAHLEAEDIKLGLECGRLKPGDMPGRIIVEPKQMLVSRIESKRFEKQLLDHEAALLTERDFVNLFNQLGKSLASRNPDNCLKILDQIKKMQPTKLMLIRNPEYVQNIRALCVFAAKEEELKEDYLVIRQESTELYNDFMKIFGLEPGPEDKFWEYFSEQVEVFKTTTKDMKEIFRTSLSEQTYQRLLDSKKTSTSASPSQPDKIEMIN